MQPLLGAHNAGRLPLPLLGVLPDVAQPQRKLIEGVGREQKHQPVEAVGRFRRGVEQPGVLSFQLAQGLLGLQHLRSRLMHVGFDAVQLGRNALNHLLLLRQLFLDDVELAQAYLLFLLGLVQGLAGLLNLAQVGPPLALELGLACGPTGSGAWAPGR